MSKEITVVFRYDDFSSVSPINVDEKLIEAFGQNHLTCTVGVTPIVTSGEFRDPTPRVGIPLDQARRKMLRDGVACGAIDVALHGYDHRTIGARPLHSEFKGLKFSLQLEKLIRGRLILQEASGAPIIVFIPPWNTYDRNTLRALQEAGMGCISANRYGAVDRKLSLTYLPITIELQDLRKALDVARKSDDASPAVVVLMHPYDFKESKDPRGRFAAGDLGEDLVWLASQPDVKVLSVSEVHHVSESIGPDRYISNTPFCFEAAAPPFIVRTEDRVVYLSLRKGMRVRFINQFVTLFCYVGVAIFFVAMGYVADRMFVKYLGSTMTMSSIRIFGAAVLGSHIILAALRNRLSARRLLIWTVGVGLLSGSWMADSK